MKELLVPVTVLQQFSRSISSSVLVTAPSQFRRGAGGNKLHVDGLTLEPDGEQPGGGGGRQGGEGGADQSHRHHPAEPEAALPARVPEDARLGLQVLAQVPHGEGHVQGVRVRHQNLNRVKLNPERSGPNIEQNGVHRRQGQVRGVGQGEGELGQFTVQSNTVGSTVETW